MNQAYSSLETQWLREGFSDWPKRGNFVPAIARMFFKPDADRLIFRVEVLRAHCNGYHIAHGGFISTMADVWLANNVAHPLPKDSHFVTASLSVDFLRPVKAGAWLESEIDRIKHGSRLHHASGAILSDGRPVAAMRAVFAVLNSPP